MTGTKKNESFVKNGVVRIRKCHFLVTLACLDISSKKRCL